MSRKIMTETFGNIDDAFITEALEYRRERRKITMSKKRLITAAIAAAVTVLLSVSVVAATFTGLTDGNNAIGSAMTYVVRNAETKEEGDMLANYILAGLSYDEMFEEQQANLGFSGLRPVYHVSFKVGGYAYDVDVDAKTGVVISCERQIDEGWEEHLENDVNGGKGYDPSAELYSGIEIVAPTPNVEYDMGDIPPGDTFLIAETYFGLDVKQGDNCWHEHSARSFANYATSPITYVVQEKHAGYVYECSINSATGEVTELYVGEDPDFNPEDYSDDVHKHTRLEEYIGSYQATIIAREELGLPDKSLSPVFWSDFYVSGSIVGESPSYEVYAFYYNDGQNINNVVIDAKTGEVIEKGAEPANNGASQNIQLPSAEAPEGMISEAEAQVIVLEDLGITDRDIKGFTIELKESENPNESYYEINIAVSNEISYIYKVNAVSGQISDKSGR